MKLVKICAIALLGFLLAAPALAGNSKRLGTSGASELRIPVSARGMALGDGVIASVTGVEGLYYNPAGISRSDATEVYFSHLNYIADMHKNYFAATRKTYYGSLGIMVDVFSVGEIEETTEDQPEGTGQTFSPTFTVLGLAYSRALTDAVSVGVVGKLITEKVLDASAMGPAFDVGMQYNPGWRSLRLGLLLKNFGPSMHYDGSGFESFHQTSNNPNASSRSLRSQSGEFELPSLFQMGASYTVLEQGQSRVDGFGCFTNNNFGYDAWQVGGEYTYGGIAALRAGYSANGDESDNYGVCYGLGLKIPMGGSTSINVDYGRRTVLDYFDDNQMISVRLNF
jgi:hypothetical protein